MLFRPTYTHVSLSVPGCAASTEVKEEEENKNDVVIGRWSFGRGESSSGCKTFLFTG